MVDPGMFRTTQTNEFYLAVSRYPVITYKDIKGLVYNSIRYSFLESPKKQELIKKLDKNFQVFEEKWAKKFRQSIPFQNQDIGTDR